MVHVVTALHFNNLSYKQYNKQEATRRAQEKAAERVKCLEEELEKSR